MKILIGTPIDEHKKYCWDEYVESIKALNNPVLIADTSKKRELEQAAKSNGFMYRHIGWKHRALDRLNKARNLVIKYAIKHQYDYILFVDADVLILPDTITNLLKNNKKYVSGLYVGFQKFDPTIPHAMARICVNAEYKAIPQEWYDGKIHKVDLTGMGSLLIHKDLFDIKFRCERDKKGKILKWEDQCYCEDVINKHLIDLFLDTNVNCKHLVKGNHWKNYKAI